MGGAIKVPEFRVAYTITTDKLDALSKKLKPKGVTMTALLAKAAGIALTKHPLLFAGEASAPAWPRAGSACSYVLERYRQISFIGVHACG